MTGRRVSLSAWKNLAACGPARQGSSARSAAVGGRGAVGVQSGHAPPGPRVTGRGGQLGPGDPGLQPAGGRDDPDQLVIGQGSQPVTLVAGQGVHHTGQQRARRHRIGTGRAGRTGTHPGPRPARRRTSPAPRPRRRPGHHRATRHPSREPGPPGAFPVTGGGTEPSGSSPSQPGLGNGSWRTHHRPLGRNLGSTLQTIVPANSKINQLLRIFFQARSDAWRHPWVTSMANVGL